MIKTWGQGIDLPAVSEKEAQEAYLDATSVTRSMKPAIQEAVAARDDMLKDRFNYVSKNLNPASQYVVMGGKDAAVAPAAIGQGSFLIAGFIVLLGGIASVVYVKTQWGVASPKEFGDRLREKGAARREVRASRLCLSFGRSPSLLLSLSLPLPPRGLRVMSAARACCLLLPRCSSGRPRRSSCGASRRRRRRPSRTTWISSGGRRSRWAPTLTSPSRAWWRRGGRPAATTASEPGRQRQRRPRRDPGREAAWRSARAMCERAEMPRALATLCAVLGTHWPQHECRHECRSGRLRQRVVWRLVEEGKWKRRRTTANT